MKVVQELMGYATMEMTMRYAHLSPDFRREAVCALHSGEIGGARQPVEKPIGVAAK